MWQKLLKTFPWLQSSVDPEKLSLTIRGLVIFVPSVVTLGTFFGWTFDAEGISKVINQGAVAVGALATLWGLIRKLIPNNDQTK